MQKFKRLKKYKARNPEETIAFIQGILSEKNIQVSESTRCEASANVFSTRLVLADPSFEMADFGTNGKGMTELYSRASAYAELMERLQNLIIFGDYAENAYANGLTKYAYAPDEMWQASGEMSQKCQEILGKILRVEPKTLTNFDNNFLNDRKPTGGAEPTNSNTGKVPFAPYEDIFAGQGEDDEKSVVLLPCRTLRMVVGSNGMAAGNNRKEAITQGLCELYERAAVMEAYKYNNPIRQLHLESFEENDIYEKLVGLKSVGYQVKILDLSMEKDYPVVGLLLEKNGRKAFKAGADPCPVTALERCLTEMFQGSEEEVARNFHSVCCKAFPSVTGWERMEIGDQEIAYHVDGSGLIADCLFNPAENFNENFACTEGESEDTDYEYMLGLSRKLGYGLYVRDCSLLGFPSYHIIVPELSNYDLVFEDGLDIYQWSLDEICFRMDPATEGVGEVINKILSP